MKKLLTILFIFMSVYMFGQTSMGNINVPTSSTNFPLAIAPYSYEVTQVDSNLTIVITGSYTTSDNLRDVYSDGNYYVLSGGGGTSNWDKSNDTITPIAGVDVVDIRGDTLSADGSLWFTDPHNTTNVMIGDGAGATRSTHGNDNIGVGRGALAGIDNSAADNISIGSLANDAQRYGSRCISIGTNANGSDSNIDDAISIGTLTNTVAGSDDAVVIGNYSGWLGRQQKAVSIGTNAGRNGGDLSVKIGFESGYTGGGSGNILIGYQSGYNWTGSNALFIENSNSTTPLIFGDFSADSVKIHGELTHNNAIGEMYFSEADTISTATTSWYSPTKFTLGDFYGTSVVGDTGLVITQNGWYQVNASPSFEHSNTNVVIHYGIFVNDVLDVGMQIERTIGTGANQFGSGSLSGIIKITNAPDTLQVKVNADKTGNLISNHTNVTAVRIR